MKGESINMKSLHSIKSMPRVILLVVLAAFIAYAGLKFTTQAAAAEPVKSTAPAAKPAATKVSPILDPKDPKSVLYLDTKGNLAGTGDPAKSGPASEAAKAGAGWHPAALTSTILPKDRYGLVDWAKSVKDNVITPRGSLDPKEEEMPAMDMNVVIETKSDFINNVNYPHYMHTWWLKCEVCHPAIFMPAKGQNNMTMSGIVQGQWCGRCHGKVAFPLTDCARCHTQPKAAAAPKAAPIKK